MYRLHSLMRIITFSILHHCQVTLERDGEGPNQFYLSKEEIEVWEAGPRNNKRKSPMYAGG